VAVLTTLRGRPDQAIEMLLLARTQHPEDPLIYLTMGEVYLRSNDADNAIKALRHACNLGPELPITWFNFGAALSQAGFNEHAAAALRQTLKLDPQHQGARTLLAHGLNAEGKSHEAAAEFRRILAFNPGNGSAWWGLATLKPMPLGKDDLTAIDRVFAQPDDETGDSHGARIRTRSPVGASGKFFRCVCGIRKGARDCTRTECRISTTARRFRSARRRTHSHL
jgi:tetratricopeptide (TPR) repeat protein